MALGLDQRPLREDQDGDWSAWHFFWVDERWVPWEDAESNHGKARKGIFSRLGIPGSQIYPLDYAISPAENVRAWEVAMRTVFKTRADQLPRFDLILLGIGEDGHTASLFPGHPAANERQRWMAAVFDAPKRPPIRITMTLPLINNARNILFVAAGANKRPILSRVLNPLPEEPQLPAQRVVPTQGKLRWFVDRAATSGLAAG
jgi:6-phosphogluconolactonase